MKRLIIFLLSTVFAYSSLQTLSQSTGPSNINSAQGFESVTNDYEQDYQRSGAALDDSLDEHVPIGFSFPFNGSSYTEVIISSNGVIYFRDSGEFDNNDQRSVAAHYYNQELSTNSGSNYAMPNALYVYWDDLNPYKGGKIKYGTIGSGEGKHFVVSWEDVPHYNKEGSYSFQVALYQDGTIIYRYDKNSDANGNSSGGATIGVKEDANHYEQYAYNSSINQKRDVVYRTIKELNPPSYICPSPKSKILMATYSHNKKYPNDFYEFKELRQNNQSIYGSGYVDSINGSGNPYGSNNHYWSHFGGYINLPQSGEYKFGIDGDDAVEVYIDDKLITGWYGGHGRANHAEYVVSIKANAGYHKIDFYQEEYAGGDNYYLYWQKPSGSLQIVPKSAFFHCSPDITKNSCIIDDPVNNTNNPKRVPGATVRYAIEVNNYKAIKIDDVKVKDSIDENLFDKDSIKNLSISNTSCNCKNPASTYGNGSSGSGNGDNPVILDFGTIAKQSKKCGYFEVKIK